MLVKIGFQDTNDSTKNGYTVYPQTFEDLVYHSIKIVLDAHIQLPTEIFSLTGKNMKTS